MGFFASLLFAIIRFVTLRLFHSLRYLLHIFMEAGCLEWCTVTALILRDSAVMGQIISSIQRSEISNDVLQGIKDGMLAVDGWASSDW